MFDVIISNSPQASIFANSGWAVSLFFYPQIMLIHITFNTQICNICILWSKLHSCQNTCTLNPCPVFIMMIKFGPMMIHVPALPSFYSINLGPLLLTWINTNSSKWGWNYSSIPKLQWLHNWSFGMDKQFYPTYYNGCNYLSMLGLKLNHVSKRGPWSIILLHCTIISICTTTLCS